MSPKIQVQYQRHMVLDNGVAATPRRIIVRGYELMAKALIELLKNEGIVVIAYSSWHLWREDIGKPHIVYLNYLSVTYISVRSIE
ncbi:hypothetical protein CR513_24106, partial [Mucuna pruriens]